MNSSIRLISPSEYVTSQWAGGATTQVAIGPEGAQYADRSFLWRISSATVNLEESDFTALPDYNRYLSIMQGNIDVSHDGGENLTLTPWKIHAFDGGVITRSWGKCVDFNLMLRKGQCDGRMACLQLPEGSRVALPRWSDLPEGNRTTVIYCAQGDVSVTAGGDTVSALCGQAVQVSHPADLSLSCTASAALMICEIVVPER